MNVGKVEKLSFKYADALCYTVIQWILFGTGNNRINGIRIQDLMKIVELFLFLKYSAKPSSKLPSLAGKATAFIFF